jgi:hypothetical protein
VEIRVRVGENGRIELVDEQSRQIESMQPLSPPEAALLARGLLVGATTLSEPDPPTAGTVLGDALLRVVKWSAGPSIGSGLPGVIFTLPSGIELSFQLSPQAARELGSALGILGDRPPPSEQQGNTVH